MSGVDEQFYPCPCGETYGWYVKGSSAMMLGWLLDPKSGRREEKKGNGIDLVHLYDGMENVSLDTYVKRIRSFKCRMCEKSIKGEERMKRLINFIRQNWNDRTIRESGWTG